ncbi:MAG TPA: TIR domain-containing protein [Sphingomicrobium sp.]|jgi:adenylate cyclase|nr:TIR domain-containing protein [Sphingomicrobium sp.]
MPDTRDVFISYARSSEEDAHRIAQSLRQEGFSVWRDDELPAHRSYSDVIEERLKSARAVVVLWSAESAKSHWVRAEANTALEGGTLVQAMLDGTFPPMPFNQIQCADLKGWNGDTGASGWQKLQGSVAALIKTTDDEAEAAASAASSAQTDQLSICVLPFVNMSGEAEQEYFSDGISEDIITDLSNVSALSVVARNTSFTFKGESLDVKEVAQKLGVTHVLEGSVRKAGNRVRITAQLIDGAKGDHVWAARFDRDLTDIFEIQDEISKAIVDALKVKLLPAEKKAIEQRGTNNVEAYNLYLMARQQWVSGNFGDPRRDDAIVRVCKQATRLDPDYAQAWALMALAQAELRFVHGKDENALPAADRALDLNASLPEAHCIKGRYLEEEGKADEAEAQIRTALKLDSDSWEVNREAARMLFRRGHAREAIPFFAKATSLMESDWHNPLMLTTCYGLTGDKSELRKAAKMVLERAERAVAKEATNGQALAAGANALMILGDNERGLDWSRRARLLDPDNLIMCYNLACAIAQSGGAIEDAVDTLQPFLDGVKTAQNIRHLEADPDLNRLREDARFKEMLDAAKQRLGMPAAVSDA